MVRRRATRAYSAFMRTLNDIPDCLREPPPNREWTPRRGLLRGAAWAAGSVFMLGTGVLADAIGVVPAAAASMPAILVASALTLHPALRPVGRPRG